MINEDIIKKIRNWGEIANKGGYANGKDVTEIYNQVLGKNVPSTNCSSCIRQRVRELNKHLDLIEAQTTNKEEQNNEQKSTNAD